MLTYYKRISYIFHSATILAQYGSRQLGRSSVAHRVAHRSIQAMPINRKIVSLIEDAKREGGKIVMIVDAILAILLTAKLAHRQTLPPSVVGIHPANRDGLGVSATEVHALGVDITAMGWSPEACSHAVCIEADTEGAIIDFTMKVKNESEGLASCTASEISYGSLFHTNQVLCCVLAGIASQHGSLCSDGRMSKGMLAERQRLVQGVRRWSVVDLLEEGGGAPLPRPPGPHPEGPERPGPCPAAGGRGAGPPAHRRPCQGPCQRHRLCRSPHTAA